MSNYAKVLSRFWTGATGRALRGDPEAQVLASYLISSPHANMLGFYYLPLAYIANDTGLPIEGASKALQRLCGEGFCRYDRDSEVVWVLEMARIQVGEALEPKDNRVKAVIREYEALPNNLFLREFHDEYGASYHLPTARTFEAPSKPATVTVTATVPAAAEPSAPAASGGTDKSPPSRPAAIALLLRKLEQDRGKAPRITSMDPRVVEWAAKGVTDEQLREAYALAVADRDAAKERGAINAGFLDVFIAKLLNPSGSTSRLSGVTGVEWWQTVRGIEAKAVELGLAMPVGEHHKSVLARICLKLGPGSWWDERDATLCRFIEDERERAAA